MDAVNIILNNTEKNQENDQIDNNVDNQSTSEKSNNSDVGSNISSDSDETPPEEYSPTYVNKVGDDEIDSIRDKMTNVSSLLIVNRDVIRSDYGFEIHNTMLDIMADTAQKLTRFKFQNQNIFNLNFIQNNNLKFNIIPKLTKDPVTYDVARAENMPTFNTTLPKLNKIDFDELNKLIIKANKSISKIDSKSFLTISNDIIAQLTNGVRKIRDINLFIDNFGANDATNILTDSDRTNYLNIFNYETNMVTISNQYNILELMDIIIPLSEAIRIDSDIIQSTEDFYTTKLYKSTYKMLHNFEEFNKLPQSIKDIYSKLNNSDIYSKDVVDITFPLYSFNTFSDIIKYISNGLGILSIKKSNTRSVIDFNNLKQNILNIFNNIDINNIKTKVNKIIALFDDDILSTKQQVGILIQKLDANNLGIDPEFYNILKLLVDLKDLYDDGIDAFNKLSIGSSVIMQYMTIATTLIKVQSSMTKINNILDKIQTNPNLITSLNSAIEEIHGYKGYLEIAYHELLTLNTSIQPVSDQFSDLDNFIKLIDVVKELRDNFDKIDKKYPFNINKLDILINDYKYIKTLKLMSEHYSEFVENIFKVPPILTSLIQDIIDLYNLVYNYQFGIIGYNNMYIDAEYVDFIEFENLIGFLQTSKRIPNFIHQNFEITNDELDKASTDLHDYINNLYATKIIPIGIRIGVTLPDNSIELTDHDIAQLEAKMKEYDDIRNVKSLIKLLNIKNSFKPLAGITVDIDTDKINRKINLINYAVDNSGRYTEYDLKNRLYFCEEYKLEIAEITNNMIAKSFSQDINTAYLITPPNILLQDNLYSLIDYYDIFGDNCASAIYFMDKIYKQFNDVEVFVKNILMSPDLTVHGNTVSFSFDDDTLLEMKIYISGLLTGEKDFDKVYNNVMYFFNNIIDIIKETKFAIDLAKSVKNDKKSHEHFDVKFKNIDIVSNVDLERNDSAISSYHKLAVDQITRELIESSGSSVYDTTAIIDKLDALHKNAYEIQTDLSRTISAESFNARTKIIGYHNTDAIAKQMNKLSIKTLDEFVTYSNINLGKTAVSPLEPIKYKIFHLYTYMGRGESEYPFASNGVYYNRIKKISSKHAVYPTNYNVTLDDNSVVQLYKIYDITEIVFYGVSATLIGYGYLDTESNTFKYTKNLPFELNLYDSKYKEKELSSTCYSIGYGNISNVVNGLEAFTYNNTTLLGLCDGEGNAYVRNNDSLDTLDVTNNGKIGIAKYFTIEELASYRFGNYFGINNESYASYVFKTKDAFDNEFDVIFKNGIYQVDDDNNYYASNIFNIYGNSVDTSHTFSVTLANGHKVSVNRIRFLNYLLPDYFLVAKSEFISDLYILITPNQLSPVEPLYQQSHIEPDKNSYKLKELLELNYYPIPVISSISRYSNLYYTQEIIARNNKTYNKVYNKNGEYVGFTNGYDIVFDTKIQCNNTAPIYNNKIEYVFTTETNL